MKYHINAAAEIKECHANKRKCRYGNHYSPAELITVLIDNPELTKILKDLQSPVKNGNWKISKKEQPEKQERLAEIAELPLEKIKKEWTVSAIIQNAHRIYEWMEEQGTSTDSFTRELAFQYASDMTGLDYDVLYNSWMEVSPIAIPE